MSIHNQPPTTAAIVPILEPAVLPVAQLESLKFKASQITESINMLAWTIKNNDYAAMPSWPDILSKYNILLSQTLNFSNALLATQAIRSANFGAPTTQVNMFERIAIHPSSTMTEQELDTEAAPLLRNQQTLDVLKMESDTVRRLSEHMKTRGSLAVLGANSQARTSSNGFGYGASAQPKKPEYEDVLRECTEIREAHDRRADRAIRAVKMLREKYDWKQRVEVEVEEPEELEWDPRLGLGPTGGVQDAEEMVDVTTEDEKGEEDEEEEEEEEDEVHIEGVLVNPGGGDGPDDGSPGLFSANGSGAENTPNSADITAAT